MIITRKIELSKSVHAEYLSHIKQKTQNFQLFSAKHPTGITSSASEGTPRAGMEKGFPKGVGVLFFVWRSERGSQEGTKGIKFSSTGNLGGSSASNAKK